jgi:hypothetical protein
MAYQSQLSQLKEYNNPLNLNSYLSSKRNNNNININNSNTPSYEMTKEFSNNLFQTFLVEIEERNGIFIQNLPSKIIPKFPYDKNTLKITYKSEIYFIVFQNKQDFIDNVKNSTLLFEYLYALTKTTEVNNIILLLYMVNFADMKETNKIKSDFIYFISNKLNIKFVDISNSDELVDYIYNFNNSVLTKDSKSKITFFDTKPVQITSLTQNENIANVTFVKHLMCLPGVSERIAIAIVKEYPRLDLLYNVYLSEEYDEEEKENLLENIQVGNKRLGHALSSKIYKFFTAEKPDIKINN